MKVDLDLSGRVALVTGAGRGIGLAIAQGLASHGAAVAIQDLDLPVAQDAAVAIVEHGGRAIGLGGDMSDLSILPGLVDQTIAQLGGLHILINNAAIQKREPWTDILPDTVLRQWSANMLAPLRLCQLVQARFREQKFGRIINVSSVQSRGANHHMIGYSMSKAGLDNLTRALNRDREFISSGTTVNSILPGWFDTLRNADDLKTPEDKIKGGRHVPVGRVGQPNDCAGLAVLLCSKAGEYITGEMLGVTGGILIAPRKYPRLPSRLGMLYI